MDASSWLMAAPGARALPRVQVSRRVPPDPRVTQFWDGSALTSEWFAKNVDHSPAPAWDVYYLFDPDATWTDVPGPIVSSGGTIIGQSSALEDAITPLLARRSAGSDG